jgi:hypothetical protein
MGEILAGSGEAKLFGLSAEDWESNITTLATAAQNWIDLNPKTENTDDGSGNTTGGGETGGEGAGGEDGPTEDEKTALEAQKRAETIANAKSAAKAALEDSTGGGYSG